MPHSGPAENLLAAQHAERTTLERLREIAAASRVPLGVGVALLAAASAYGKAVAARVIAERACTDA